MLIKFAPGWAWEDFDSYFSPERSAFPMYGNVIRIQNQNEINVVPAFFENKLKLPIEVMAEKSLSTVFIWKRQNSRNRNSYDYRCYFANKSLERSFTQQSKN